jgi:hypothetical protein
MQVNAADVLGSHFRVYGASHLERTPEYIGRRAVIGMNNIVDRMLRESDRIFCRISRKKLADYDLTQTRLKATNVATDLHYQRVYKSFYVMWRRSAAWYKFYFGLLEREKANRNIKFEAVLGSIFEIGDRVEPSFSSKLVATIRPDAPIYDGVVRANLGLAKPRYDKPADVKFSDALNAYKQIEGFYATALGSGGFEKLKTAFDQRFPAFAHFTDTKKLDTLLWQWRN